MPTDRPTLAGRDCRTWIGAAVHVFQTDLFEATAYPRPAIPRYIPRIRMNTTTPAVSWVTYATVNSGQEGRIRGRPKNSKQL